MDNSLTLFKGDIWKEKWPESSYRQDFQSKPFSRRLETFNNTFADAKPIQGDPRSHGCEEVFNTSSRLFFPVHSRKEKIIVPNSTKVYCFDILKFKRMILLQNIV